MANNINWGGVLNVCVLSIKNPQVFLFYATEPVTEDPVFSITPANSFPIMSGN